MKSQCFANAYLSLFPNFCTERSPWAFSQGELEIHTLSLTVFDQNYRMTDQGLKVKPCLKPNTLCAEALLSNLMDIDFFEVQVSKNLTSA